MDLPPSLCGWEIQLVKGVAWVLRGLNELGPPHVQVVLDGQDLGLCMEMGRGSRPYAALIIITNSGWWTASTPASHTVTPGKHTLAVSTSSLMSKVGTASIYLLLIFHGHR